MAYYMPYAWQGFCDPTTMVQLPRAGESLSSPFNFGAASAAWEIPQELTTPFNLQHMDNIDLSIPGLYDSSPTDGAGLQMSVPAPPPVPLDLPCHISTSVFLQSGENNFMSQQTTSPLHTLAATPVTLSPGPPAPSTPILKGDRIVPVCHRDHAKECSATVSPTQNRTPSRVSKRYSSDPCANHSVAEPPLSEPSPPSRKRRSSSPPPSSSTPTSKKLRMSPPLEDPDALEPIRVTFTSGALPRCPMPECGAEIEPCDAAWRGHFKALHHDDLCLTPGCTGTPSATCKARCPCPIGGGCERKIAIESVGRHLLNIHIGVAYRCPVCDVEKEWRESACARHIRLCLRKKRDEMSHGGH